VFSHTPPGWPRVQAVCDFVQRHIRFDYQLARNNRTALEVYRERFGDNTATIEPNLHRAATADGRAKPASFEQPAPPARVDLSIPR